MNQRKSVLIVDDSQINLQLVSGLLQQQYHTRVAVSGREALEIVGNGPLPDLILLDVRMPEMDGYAVCADLKARPRTRDIPVIFLTGEFDQANEVKGFDSGAVDYITKPITPTVLMARVKTHLERASLYEEKNYVTELLRQTLLPKAGFRFGGVDVGHRFLPSKLLSGDFFDLIPIDELRLGVIMADVAGKGPDAAIQTVRAKYLVRALALSGAAPAAILELLNRELASDPDARALTAFYGEIDLAQNRLTYCNAGHEAGLLWNPAEDRWQELGCTAIMLGAAYPFPFVQLEVELQPGSHLLLVTDGVTEARCAAGTFLDKARLLATARDCLKSTAEELVDCLYREVHRFTDGQFSDDVTMLALRLSQ